MRAKGHCPVRKNSEVSVVAACGAHPQDVSQLANILRQVPVREVVKQVGGACQEVKTGEEGMPSSVVPKCMMSLCL